MDGLEPLGRERLVLGLALVADALQKSFFSFLVITARTAATVSWNTRMPWDKIKSVLTPCFARKDRQGHPIEGTDLFGPTTQIAGAVTNVAGRLSLPIRLMVGLLYLKHAFGESDETRSTARNGSAGSLSIRSGSPVARKAASAGHTSSSLLHIDKSDI